MDQDGEFKVYVDVLKFKDILVVLSDIMDVVIYIALDRSVRKRFVRLFSRNRSNDVTRSDLKRPSHGLRSATELETIPGSPETIHGTPCPPRKVSKS